MTNKIKPPSRLGAAGRELWSAIVAQVADDGLVLDARELRWLRDACAQADALARIEAAFDGAPLEVVGSTGQPRANPLIAEATRSRSTIAALLARLHLDDPAFDGTGRGSRTTSTSARRAALVRHHGTDGIGA
jgi:hypothetical protein